MKNLILVALWLAFGLRGAVAGVSTRDVSGQYHGEHPPHPEHILVSTDAFVPNCLCVVRNTGCIGREAFTRQFDGISTLVCGHEYERCCFEDPWPGVVDNFAGVAPCVPQEECTRFYGQEPTDIRDYGILGPCPGLGAVRCLHGGVVIPEITQIVVPVLPPPPVVYQPPPPVVYQPPPPVVFQPPPPVVYQPPPPPVFQPPPPVVFQPPPLVVFQPPPASPPGYDLPADTTPAPPPETYGPPNEIPPPTYELPPPVPPPPPPPAVVAYRPGPPYLWKNLNPFAGLYGWPGLGSGFSLRKRFGLGLGLFG